MRVSTSWLREYVELPADLTIADLDQALVRLGLEVESIVDLRETVTGPLVVGEVREIEELTGFKKPIRACRVDVGAANGTGEPQEIVCGATNFSVGDRVVVVLPGGVLPGGFAIGARHTYGRDSNGMICSARELGLGDDHSGILVLPSDLAAKPGDDARPVIGLDDVVVELSITPDRGYAMSVRGIARELAHAFGVPFHDPAAAVARTGPTSAAPTARPAYPVEVRDIAGCDRFAARLVRDVNPSAASPAWMRQRLTTAGIRTISLPVDITNYLMLELGQPMHAFDADRLRGTLVVRRAVPGERLTTLDGVDRALDVEDMVICDTGLSGGTGDGVPISLAAVMGGETSEVVPTTSNVLFEAAHWDPVMVGRTARRHKLFSEAAKRWERGVDPALPLIALNRAVELLTTYGGGTASEDVLDIDNVRPPAPILLDPRLPARHCGVAYPPERVVELLEVVGATVVADTDRRAATVGAADPGLLTVTAPSWRPDLTDPADLVEEVVRLDGYDRVPSVLPVAPPGRGLTPEQRRRRSVARTLAENGYVEVLAYPFVGPALFDALALPADDPRRRAVRLANPLSDEEPLLRTTLLGPLLGILRRNLGRGHRDVALYEIGTVFHPRSGAGRPPAMGVDRRPSDDQFAAADATLPEQPRHVAVVLAGERERSGWWGPGQPAGWADAVEAGRMVLAAAGLPEERIGVRAGEQAPWHPGRCAELLVDGEVVGHAGELHPAVVEALELPRRTSAMELNLDLLPPAPVVTAPQISGFPPALIDVALVVDEGVAAADVRRALVDGAGQLLESVRLFDVYTSPQLGSGRRSLAYKLTFRAPDRTLTGEEAITARDAAVAEAARRHGAVLRGS